MSVFTSVSAIMDENNTYSQKNLTFYLHNVDHAAMMAIVFRSCDEPPWNNVP